MCRVINVLSHKGGCGKSETVLNLAYGLHAKGKRVLVIDCDPQSNVTSILTAESSWSYVKKTDTDFRESADTANSTKDFLRFLP